ncbi:MAG: hypothetical protein WDO19_05720 [Bacteroidota bacterium]
MHSIVSDFLFSTGIAILFSIVTNKFFGISPGWGVLAFLLTFSFLLFIHRAWKTSNAGITQLLNRNYPSLEESSSLLIKPFTSLNILEKLQYQKNGRFAGRNISAIAGFKKIRLPLGTLALALLIGFIIYKLPYHLPAAQFCAAWD